MNNDTIITVKHLQKTFNGVTVLTDVNAEIKRGEVISIIGPSGTGKSTFLRCLNLLETPTGGEIIIDGTNLLDPKTNVPLLRQKMGMVFQQFNLFGHLTVLENITFAPKLLLKMSQNEANKRALELLETVGLSNKVNALPTELSGGQQQRVAIARALAMNPEIILFDEPTSALDPTMVNEVLTVIRNLAKTGITMLIVTHEMRFARDVSTRVFYMDEGIIYEEGPAKELFDNPKQFKTRAFIRRIGMLNFDFNRDDFDIYHLWSEVEAFAEKQLLPEKSTKNLLLVLEELLTQLIFPVIENITLQIEISEELRQAGIILNWHGTENPLDSTDESTEMVRMIIKNYCPNPEFTVSENGTAQLKMILENE